MSRITWLGNTNVPFVLSLYHTRFVARNRLGDAPTAA
jgi:hypothetical protein